MDISSTPVDDPEYLKLRAEWKTLNPRIDSLVSESRDLAKQIKSLQLEYIESGKDFKDGGRTMDEMRVKIKTLRDSLQARLSESESLRDASFALSKSLKAVAARFAEAEKKLRFILAERFAAENLGTTVAQIGGAAVQQISGLIRSD